MKNNKNMLIITDYSAPYEGNFIESIKSLNKEYTKEENELVYLFPERANKIEWVRELINKENFKIYFFKDDTVLDVMKMLRCIIKEHDIKILYTHFCRHKTQLAVKLVRMGKKNIKLVSHFHNHCKVNGNILKRSFMKLAYTLYEGDLNIGCSESVCESMPYKKEKATYVENGICFDRLDYSENNKEVFTKEKFTILMFGFDYYRKGVDLAIRAVKELNNPDIILAISLASNKDKIISNIEKEFGEVPSFVKFLDSINNVADYYNRADLFLSAAREEGFCYSLVEAAYCKTRILSSNIPGVPKDIPGEYIFESENYVDLAKKIQSIYGAKNNQIDDAKDFVKKEYSIENWTKGIIQKLHGCVQNIVPKKEKMLYYNIALLIVAIAFVLLNSISTVLYGFNGNVDSCIFNLIGKYWSKGDVSYITLFDHKGPIIFFVNMLSWKIFNCERGILVFQIIALYASLVGLMKIAGLKQINPKKRLFIVVLSLSYLIITYFAGNMTEEYCLPFIIGSLYFNIKFFKEHLNNKGQVHSLKYAVFYGVSFGICFLTRFTNAVSICTGILVIAIILIREKRYNELLKNGIAFLLGLGVCVIPFVIYFYSNNAFEQFLDATLFFNIKYATKNASWLQNNNLLLQVCKFLMYYFPSYMLLFAGIRKFRNGQKECGVFYIVTSIMEVILFASNRLFRHYGTIVLPNLLIVLMETESFRRKYLKRIIYAGVIISIIILEGFFTKQQLDNPPINTEVYDVMFSSFSEEDKQSFIMWNGNVTVYEQYDIKPYYKYFVTQPWHASFSADTEKDVYNTFYDGDVKWILFNGNADKSMIGDIIYKRYELVETYKGMTLYRLKYSEE